VQQSLNGGTGELRTERFPLSFSWVDAGEQDAWVRAFAGGGQATGGAAGSTPLQPPAMIALNPRKRRFAVMRGSFTPRAMHDFVTTLMQQGSPQQGIGGVDAWTPPPVSFESLAGEVPQLREQPALQPPKKRKAAASKGGKSKGRKARKGGGSKPSKAADAEGMGKEEL